MINRNYDELIEFQGDGEIHSMSAELVGKGCRGPRVSFGRIPNISVYTGIGIPIFVVDDSFVFEFGQELSGETRQISCPYDSSRPLLSCLNFGCLEDRRQN
jgi:hypothetical protein